MGIGPAVAIPEATRKAGLRVEDVDLFELNEAFASQATYCAEKLGLDPERVNVNGGAIALGHPLGATGARCVATLLHEMKRTGRNTESSPCASDREWAPRGSSAPSEGFDTRVDAGDYSAKDETSTRFFGGERIILRDEKT